MPSYYSIILPVAGTNLVANPSYERGITTGGIAGTNQGTVNRVAGTAAFGAWALCGTPQSGVADSGAVVGTFGVGASGSYTVSAYVLGGSSTSYRLQVNTLAGAFIAGTQFTSAGSYVRYSFSYGDNTGAGSRQLIVTRISSANAAPFYVDGAQVESGTFLTTYMDGDQEGCTWLSNAHNSASLRSGTSRQGGTAYPLDSLGLRVLENGGVGMPPVNNITQEYAIADGALWQRQRAMSRPLTLTGFMSGSTWPGLHAVRQQVVNALKVNRTANPQPARLLYTGAGGLAQLDVYYDGGLSFDSRDGFTETAAIKLLATDPYWEATTDQGTALLTQTTFGSANSIVYRSPTGQWGTMGPSGSSLVGGLGAGTVYSIAINSGTVFVGGNFRTAGGTTSGSLAQWYPQLQQWGSMSGGTTQGAVYAMAFSPDGTLYLAGGLANVGGTASKLVAFYAGAGFGTLPGAVPTNSNGIAYALTYTPGGSIIFGGSFSLPGTLQNNIAFWYNNAVGTLTSPSGTGINIVSGAETVYALANRPTNGVVIGGFFTNAGGTTANGIASWDGAYGTLSSGGGPSGLSVSALVYGLDGVLYAGGQFGTMGAVVTPNIASYNGAQWASLGAGLGTYRSGYYNVFALAIDQRNFVFAGGTFTSYSGSLTFPDEMAQWNQSAWLPLDIDLSDTRNIRAITVAPDNTLYVGGDFAGPGTAAGVTSVVNTGSADAYPIVLLRNTGSAAARVYQIVNYTTGDGVWLNLSILPGEIITMDLRPGAKTITSSSRGNVIGALLPGSNLTTWRMAPGANNISCFIASSSVEATLYYRPRAWSSDAVL